MWSAGDAIADSGDRAVLGYVKLRARPRRWTWGGKGCTSLQITTTIN